MAIIMKSSDFDDGPAPEVDEDLPIARLSLLCDWPNWIPELAPAISLIDGAPRFANCKEPKTSTAKTSQSLPSLP
jgi:hypothetical protein